MNKIIALVMMMLMLAFAGVGVAEEVSVDAAAVFDFTGYSYDELIGIKGSSMPSFKLVHKQESVFSR